MVGAQSTGKSSLLEAIIQKDVLPRGSGIVTRCPIIFHLEPIPQGEKEHCIFRNNPKKYYDWNEARKYLENETSLISGNNKGISTNPIFMQISSPKVFDLILIDLPGITKIPIGDQPSDIELRIRELILTYIKNPNAIILAVTPANTDLANSDSLKLAREVDPKGERTIGILTKMDLVEDGSEYFDVMEGKLYKLKYGYVGVKLRRQNDLDNGVTVEQALEEERNFFQNNKQFAKVADRMGITYLASMLNQTFMAHTKKTLPTIKDSINSLVTVKQYELKQYGDLLFEHDDSLSKGLYILNLLSKFATAFTEAINGSSLKADKSVLTGGARIHYIISESFKTKLMELSPVDNLTDEDIRLTIYNSSGLKPSLFLPESAFEVLVKQQLGRLLDPCLEICQMVHDELRKIVLQINIPELLRFETFCNKIVGTMERLLKERLKPTIEMVRNLIDIQQGFINTSHPNFISGSEALIAANTREEKKNEQEKKDQKEGVPVPKIKEVEVAPKKESGGGLFGFFSGKSDVDAKIENLTKSAKGNKNIEDADLQQYGRGVLKQPQAEITLSKKAYDQRERVTVETTKKLLISYFDFVKRDIVDLTVKTIVTFLIENSRGQCERYLVANLYKESMYDELLSENPEIAKARKECYDTLKNLKKCQEVLEEIDAKL